MVDLTPRAAHTPSHTCDGHRGNPGHTITHPHSDSREGGRGWKPEEVTVMRWAGDALPRCAVNRNLLSLCTSHLTILLVTIPQVRLPRIYPLGLMVSVPDTTSY